jgi:hypothetical protein
MGTERQLRNRRETEATAPTPDFVAERKGIGDAVTGVVEPKVVSHLSPIGSRKDCGAGEADMSTSVTSATIKTVTARIVVVVTTIVVMLVGGCPNASAPSGRGAATTASQTGVWTSGVSSSDATARTVSSSDATAPGTR